MNYFFDTEFLEGTQDRKLFGYTYGETKNTIDLISIGIIDELDRVYYAVSKEFNLREAWNRFQVDTKWKDGIGTQHKVYWIRVNVLRHIFNGFMKTEAEYEGRELRTQDIPESSFTYKNFKSLLDRYGETREKIAEEIIEFTKYRMNKIISAEGPTTGAVLYYREDGEEVEQFRGEHPGYTEIIPTNDIKFYAYYADYDWVVFCWIFGKMIDLPSGFPMYCRDLKQIMDEKAESYLDNQKTEVKHVINGWKRFTDFPTQFNLHNALEDALWNKNLYTFLQTLDL